MEEPMAAQRIQGDWRERQRSAASAMAESLARKLINARAELRQQAAEETRDLGRETAPFWERQSTELALQELDIWASVHKARLAGVRECPRSDAIFERPSRIEGPWRDLDTGLRDSVVDVRDPAGIEEQARVTTKRPDCPERLIYLSVNTALKSRELLIYSRVLLHYLARKGPYKGEGEIDPETMRRTDRDIISEAIRGVRDSWRRVEVDA